MMEQLEEACIELYESGQTVVKARDVAEIAGFSDVSRVGGALWTETTPDKEESQFDRIDVRGAGKTNGSNNYRLQEW